MKNLIFQKSIIFYIVAGNMIFGRKSAFWGLESIQKPYIDYPTRYGVTFPKVEKNRFFDLQNHDKIFFEVDFFGR